ncbi:MAG: hypothetical protein L0Z51_05970 [Candidatus Latescibacteria bacterium]|nr:hypothetical protein [Candidatus Latescibacterota bacterium]
MAGFFFCAFMFDVLVYISAVAFVRDVPRDMVRTAAFQWAFGGAAALSAGLWWAARSPRVSVSRLHAIASIYEVIVCFIAAFSMYWQFYIDPSDDLGASDRHHVPPHPAGTSAEDDDCGDRIGIHGPAGVVHSRIDRQRTCR